MQLTIKQAFILSIAVFILGITVGLSISTGKTFRNGFEKGYVEGLNGSSKGYMFLNIDRCNIRVMPNGTLSITGKTDSTQK